MLFFRKKDNEDSISAKKNWYADRYQTAIMQRNFLAFVTLVALGAVIISVLTVIQVSSGKTIEPFVIEIEEKTGITNVIRPLKVEKFAYDEVLQRYFIMKYINARETYDFASYEYNYNRIVKLMSDANVYSFFRRELYDSGNKASPLLIGNSGNVTIKVTSIAFIKTAKNPQANSAQISAPGFTAQVRFVATRDTKSARKVSHKLATMNFIFGKDVILSTDERDINPLGFYVTSYRVDDENL